MLYVLEDGTIRLTRGDTARLTVSIFNEVTQSEYEMEDADTLTMSVKRKLKDAEYSFQKVITGSNTFHILPEDTAGLSFASYTYDVQLKTKTGDVFTVIEPGVFEILPEVTC